MLAFFSFAVFVHVSSLKFFERRAVLSMQRIEMSEGCVVSGGGSSWYLSYAPYMKFMLVVGSYAFTWSACTDLGLQKAEGLLRIAAIIFLSLSLAFVWLKDWLRNAEVLAEIRENITQQERAHANAASH